VAKSIPTEVWQRFVPLLADAVSRPDEEHPTVRVWKDTELIRVINRIAKGIRTESRATFPPGSEVLEQLERTGWLRRLPLSDNVTGRTLFLMDQEATKDEVVDPLEVLQAVLPSGVISFFGAIGFHELTSQMPAFFHIGRLANGHPPESTAPAEATAPAGASERNPLGTELFEFDGVPCYETKRYRGLTPGVQMRVIGSRTCYRVTTLEQTLLDAILQPVRCGGEAVVFEAWGHATERADFDRMAEHLQAIGRDSLLRRVGAMLEMLGATVKGSAAFDVLLSAVKDRTGSRDEMIPLLPGLNYGQAAGNWGVLIP
jgi:predicted transcriptional regulator of viral defense system